MLRRFLPLLFMIFHFQSPAQTRVPDLSIKDIYGNEIILSHLIHDDLPLVIIFWATWCNPCIEELENISDILPDWQEEVDFNLITICTDDSRSSENVYSFISGRQWDFPVLLDDNQDVMRAMNVTLIPHYFIFDSHGLLVSRHSGYLPGDEEIMFNKIRNTKNEH